MLEDEWGTKEYFEKRARESGEKKARKEVLVVAMKILKEQGMSEEEARQALEEKGLVLE